MACGPGLLLIALDLFAFASSEMQLGARRLVGQAELTGTGELAVSGLLHASAILVILA